MPCLTLPRATFVAAHLLLAGCAAIDAADESFRRLFDGDLGSAIDLAPAPRPVLVAGDTFVYEGKRVRQVASVANGSVRWRDLERDLYRTSPDFFVPTLHQRRSDRTVTRQVLGDPSALWPLAPGRRVEFIVDTVTVHDDGRRDGPSRRFWRCRVPGAREAETPAGTFDAYRVVCQSARSPAGSPVVVVSWDFAPRVGHVVAREWRNVRTGERAAYALEAVLPGALATPERLRAVLARLASDD